MYRNLQCSCHDMLLFVIILVDHALSSAGRNGDFLEHCRLQTETFRVIISLHRSCETCAMKCSWENFYMSSVWFKVFLVFSLNAFTMYIKKVLIKKKKKGFRNLWTEGTEAYLAKC